jgi:dihydroflavonol-4-reductase
VKLVIGANGFLGSHVTRRLVDAGNDVRVMVRPNANTVAIDNLPTESNSRVASLLPAERFTGDIWDNDVLRDAMTGCDDVYYCVVDTRAWLRDPAPLYRTNVEGTRNVLDVACSVHARNPLRRFVFTSSYTTVNRRPGAVATEADEITDTDGLNDYVRSRLIAERMVTDCGRRGQLPTVAMCVSTTYGPGDWGQTPHGEVIAQTARGHMPVVLDGIAFEAVGVEDAARAMILAAERGRNGERYLLSDKMITNAEVVRIAAAAAGVRPPKLSIPPAVLRAAAALGTLKGRLTGSDEKLSLKVLSLMLAEAPLDHSKAVRELGWQPAPVEESIRAAARWWVETGAGLKGS